MSGYREHSFDPNAGGDYGPPLRPYNWVQWTGVALMAGGFAVLATFLAGKAGWLAFEPKDSLALMGSNLTLFGTLLVSSRREPVALSPETKRRRSLIILAALAVCASVAATIIYFQGA